MSTDMFDGVGKPQSQARRYVYRVIAIMLENSTERRWFFDGIEEEPDQRRIKKALLAVGREMSRKGKPGTARAQGSGT